MTPLDAARRMAEREPLYEDDAMRCFYCGANRDNPEYGREDHRPDCSWEALPKIVAVMEAAERLTEREPVEGDRAGYGECLFCAAPNYSGAWPSAGDFKTVEHDDGCPWGALVAAMRGAPS